MSQNSQGINPKDALGLKKVSLGLLPSAGKIAGALAMADGARKYGPFNWRKNAVLYSIYLDAIERHLLAVRDGQDHSSDANVHHLGHIIACCSILLDAMETGSLKDDRHHGGPASKLLDRHTASQDRAISIPSPGGGPGSLVPICF